MLEDKDEFTSEEAERWLDSCVINANLAGGKISPEITWWTLKQHAAWLIKNSPQIDNALIERGLLPC